MCNYGRDCRVKLRERHRDSGTMLHRLQVIIPLHWCMIWRARTDTYITIIYQSIYLSIYGYIVLHDDILGLWCLDRTHRIHIHKFRFLQSALKLLFFKAVSRIIMACKARASDGCIY